MFKESGTFIPPADENMKIWRYMDFTKLVSLIDTKKLFFCRADKFDDPFEGSYPRLNVEFRKKTPISLPKEHHQDYINGMKKRIEVNKDMLRYITANCWHMNEYESAAMWNLYLKSDEGIAIQSTYKLLKESIIDEEDVFISKVKYIDYDKDLIVHDMDLSAAFIHKRISYEHEKELRAIAVKWPIEPRGLNFSKETIKGGLQIKVDVKTLIQKIHIAPNSPNWFKELVQSVVKHYGYGIEVIRSELDKDPLF